MSPDFTRARARTLGIDIRDDEELGTPFPCILRGHHHLARLSYYREGRYCTYRCDDLDRAAGFGELRGFLAYNQVRAVSGLEAARWGERLDYEAGLREPIPLDLRLPDESPRSALVVATRMCEFVGLRDPRWAITEPFVFADEFAQAYCDLTAERVRYGKAWLERNGIIRRVHETRRYRQPIEWMLVAQDAAREPTEGRT